MEGKDSAVGRVCVCGERVGERKEGGVRRVRVKVEMRSGRGGRGGGGCMYLKDNTL